MYKESVSQVVQMLENLDRWIDKGIEHAKAKSFDPSVLLQARLAPDQYPLTRQVQSACDAAKYLGGRLAGKVPPSHPDSDTATFKELKTRIHAVVDYLKALTAADFEGAETRVVALSWMPGKGLNAPDYFQQLALPNFYFHVTTAYSILRHNGVTLGKSDFIGHMNVRDV